MNNFNCLCSSIHLKVEESARCEPPSAVVRAPAVALVVAAELHAGLQQGHGVRDIVDLRKHFHLKVLECEYE